MIYTEIKDLLGMIDDPVARLECVMDIGRTLNPVPGDALCNDISGCASRVQICRRGNNFFATADAAIVRGIVAILISMVDGLSPDAIRNMDLHGEFSSLKLNLGAGRMNGVNSMIRFLQNL